MIKQLASSQFWLPLLLLWLTLLLLLALQWLLPLLPTWAAPPTTLLLALPIGVFQYEFGRRRRLAILNAFLVEQGVLHKLLRGRPWLMLKSGLAALLLALILIAALANVQPLYFWATMILWVPLWVVTFSLLKSLMGTEVSAIHQTMVTMRILGWISGGLLIVILVLLSLFEPVPDLSGLTFTEALIQSANASAHFNSVWLAQLTDAWAIVDTVRMWLVQSVPQAHTDNSLIIVAWVIALIQKALVIYPVMVLFQAVHSGLIFWLSQTAEDSLSDREV